ncbi:hypothetical protein DPMN_147798 [Dreissena polymorpha]|uniref:Uncharacterized protein n=1 Tax=Dreissena polymorpha TaxID=45954 RepID=A0A9D4FED0_DREPO|nr:hypothetical protein DPMN_147798 [Dreissena polymorpha]
MTVMDIAELARVKLHIQDNGDCLKCSLVGVFGANCDKPSDAFLITMDHTVIIHVLQIVLVVVTQHDVPMQPVHVCLAATTDLKEKAAWKSMLPVQPRLYGDNAVRNIPPAFGTNKIGEGLFTKDAITILLTPQSNVAGYTVGLNE